MNNLKKKKIQMIYYFNDNFLRSKVIPKAIINSIVINNNVFFKIYFPLNVNTIRIVINLKIFFTNRITI